ncbi:class F sortase [Arthrobacter sp. CDRTa11]|uniref:class F sortase n=1 Tax=Arthrobacter sp. CDRTa11 TaxID=2651199 RepID=UPI0022658F6A|nr:class F sortase [Arthrobacter sp. CDRTa11]UZX03753.1 class F sortase [Arthrobacter sp. CDRTa11]
MDTDHQAGTLTAAGSGSWRRAMIFVVLCGVLGYLVVALIPLLAGGGSGIGSAPDPAPASAPAAGQWAEDPAPSGPESSSPVPSDPQLSSPPVAAVPAGPAAAPPQRLVYAAAGIDVAVHPLDPNGADVAASTIIPPSTIDGYWLTPFGMPGEGSVNTTYIVGHSWADMEAPFNRLSTMAAAGDRLTVATSTGELTYQVDQVTTYVKSGLKDSPVWDVAPHRLVLISCYTGDLWGTNVVVIASPVG